MLWVVLCASCGDDDGSPVCAIGETQTCVGPGGCEGGQACLPDRSGWETCDCGGMDAAVDGAADAGLDATSDAGDDSGGDGDVDASACIDSGIADLLFVVDSTNRGEAEQTILASEIPRLIAILVSGDLDADGTAELDGLMDVHVGVVSTDLGAGDGVVPTCTVAGDDGVLLTRTAPGCDAITEAIRSVDEASDAVDVACLVRGVGIGGCGFPHPLDAALKALTVSTAATRFARDTTGHADGLNDGFRRADAPLGVFIVSTRDDCSASDLDLFSPSSEAYSDTPYNQRCTRDDALYPLSRYSAEAFGDPERLVFGVVAGLPDDVDLVEGTDVSELAADDRLEPVLADGDIADVCTSDGGGAQPGQRLVETAAGWADDAAGVVVGSICRDSYAAITNHFAEHLIRTARCAP